MNYFVNEFHILDLENNIPIQSANDNSLFGSGIGYRYVEQRKIYQDSSRSLSIDSPNYLNYPLSRMDLLFWHNIVELGEDAQTISKNISLSQLGDVYQNQSLFHYFSDNVEVIEMIHHKFKTKFQEGTIKEDERLIPLTLLNHDNEGRTAL